MLPYLSGLVSCLVLVIYLLGRYYVAAQRPKNFPPGPPTLPFIGNLHQIPASRAYLRWEEWKKEYGSIIGLKLGSQNAIVLNSYKAVAELFDKRGGIYSSRPQSYVTDALVGFKDVHILLLPYGNTWRHQRKLLQGFLNVNAIGAVLPIQTAEASHSLYQLLKEPQGWYDHIRRYSTAVILASVYGQRGKRFDSPRVQALYEVQDRWNEMIEPATAPPVEDFPILKYLPEFICTWKRKVRAIRHGQKSLYFALLEETRQKVREGQTDCFMAKLLARQEEIQMDDEHLAHLCGIFMEAGSDTTASVLLTFVLAMASHSEVLKKAQEELDSVCGPDRSPNWDDCKQLTYMPAIINEASLSRVLEHHVVFENIWAISRDESEYKEPDRFFPERFLVNRFGTQVADDGNDDLRKPSYAFGGGRRVCPGQYLAQNSLLVNMAKIAWAFDIVPEKQPVDVDIRTAFTEGMVTTPLNFPVDFKARSPMHAAIVEREFKAADSFLAKLED
ncbi:Cytochrome P450 monooxygenase patH [Lasiodiplodia theobromae]|uniref:Cytochrome P450 monooxygenase patH n=1 Tax=Lasiodiplodia theobromae TaxID=45133 RepID=A0A5N5D7X1_9PEZI|nr:Cytochrome P450 monooxygenase patH [Lasiodiplodia theobromae]